HPFDAADPSALFRQHLKQPPPPFAVRAPGADVPPELEAVVLKLLAKDPAARYQSADDLIDAIDDAMPGAVHDFDPEPAPPSGPTPRARGPTPRRRASTAADTADPAPPPPAPSAHAVAAPPSLARRVLRVAALTVVVLGGAGAAWKLGVLGIDVGPRTAATVI